MHWIITVSLTQHSLSSDTSIEPRIRSSCKSQNKSVNLQYKYCTFKVFGPKIKNSVNF